MSFRLFTSLFNQVDTATATFVNDISSRAIVAITPIVIVGLTLSFIVYGMLVIRGVIDSPVMEFLMQSVRISIITSVALTGGLYQTDISKAICALPNELVNALITNSSQENGVAASIDLTAQQGFDRAAEAFEHSGFFKENGIVYAMIGIIIVLNTSFFISIGGAIILLTKLALAILTGLGPFFIIALLWKPTARFFDMWIAQVLNYVLLVVLFTAVFGLMVSIFGSYMEDMEINGIQSVAYSLGGSVVLSIAMIIVLLQLPSIATGLAGGVSLSFPALRTARNTVTSVYGAVKGLDNSSTLLANVDQGSSSTSPKAETLSSKSKPIYGYYKGKFK